MDTTTSQQRITALETEDARLLGHGGGQVRRVKGSGVAGRLRLGSRGQRQLGLQGSGLGNRLQVGGVDGSCARAAVPRSWGGGV
jgi:hypothetical protein